MPTYNMIEYSSNFSETTGSLWFYAKDESSNFNNNNNNNNNNNKNTDNFKPFQHKAKLLRKTATQSAPNNTNGIPKKCNNCCAIKIFK